jgi:hypothetical protein
MWIWPNMVNRDSLTNIRDMLRQKQDVIQRAASITTHLRSTNPSVEFSSSLSPHYGDCGADAVSAVAPSEAEFDFDDEVVTAQVYRRTLAQAKALTQSPDALRVEGPTRSELGDLIDLSDNMTIRQDVPPLGWNESQLLCETLGRGILDNEESESRSPVCDVQPATTSPDNTTAVTTGEQSEDDAITAGIIKGGVMIYVSRSQSAAWWFRGPQRCRHCILPLRGLVVKLDDGKYYFHRTCFRCCVPVSLYLPLTECLIPERTALTALRDVTRF